MTTIVYDDGIIYADTQISVMLGDVVLTKRVEDKIHVTNDNEVVCGSGSVSIVELIMEKNRFYWILRLFSFCAAFTPFERLVSSDRNSGSCILETRNADIHFYHVDPVINTRFFTLLRKKNNMKITDFSQAKRTLQVCFGSGIDYFYDEYEKVKCVEKAIQEVSKLDKFTNDEITKCDLYELKGLKRID